MISADQTKKIAHGLVEIFGIPAVTYGLDNEGASQRVSVTVQNLNRDKLLRLANLSINNPEEVDIKQTGSRIHIAFLPGAKVVAMPVAKPMLITGTRKQFFDALADDVKPLAYANARPGTNWDEEVKDMRTAIDGAFDADNTPQGFRFWFRIVKEH